MTTLIFILLFLFIVWPLLRFGYTVHRMRKQAQKIFEQGNNARQRQDEADRDNRRDKMFDRNDGEYVEYEEIHTETTDAASESGSGSQSHITIEEQIVDAKWEDISPRD